MEWISVSDRLPHPDEFVLVYISSSPEVRIGFYMNENRVMKKGFWEILQNGYADEIEDVSHWMQLPPPPGK